MELPLIQSQIIEVVTRHGGGRNVSGLVRELLHEGALGAASDGGSISRRAATNAHPISQSEFFDQLVTLCQTALPGEEVPPVLLEIGDIFKATGEMAKAAEMYSLVLAMEDSSTHRSRPNPHTAEALMRRGEVNSCLGRWKASREDLTRSRSLFSAMNEKVAVGRVDNILGTNCAEQGNITLARRYFQKAYAVFEESRQTEMAGTVLMNLGILLNIRGQYDEALGQYRRAQSWFEQLGDVRRLAQLHHNIGMTHLHRGQTGEAIKEFDTAYFLGSKQRSSRVMASAVLGKATANYTRGDIALASKLVNQAIGMFEQCSDRLGQADGYKLKGMIHRDLKKNTLAMSYFRTSLRLNRELGNKLNIAETSVELGVMEQRRRHREEALRAYSEALELFRELGAERDMEKVEQKIVACSGGRHAS